MIGCAALIGAGCASNSPVSLDKYSAESTSTNATAPSSQAAEYPPGAVEETPPTEPTKPIESPTLQPIPKPMTTTPESKPSGPPAFPGILPATETAGKLVRISTTKGDIVFEVLPTEGPRAASNFVYLTNRKFYDGLTFHRVVPGFVIQGGDPLGSGMGDPGYRFEDDPVKLPYNEGIVAMANSGPNTNGSQFFIMLADNPLPPNYSIFGRVIKGMDVVKKIVIGDKMNHVTIEQKNAK